MLDVYKLIPSSFQATHIESLSKERRSIFTAAPYAMRHPGVYTRYRLGWEGLELKQVQYLSAFFAQQKPYKFFEYNFNFLQNVPHITIEGYDLSGISAQDTTQNTQCFYVSLRQNGRRILRQVMSNQADATHKFYTFVPKFEVTSEEILQTPSLDLYCDVKRVSPIVQKTTHMLSTFDITLEGAASG